MSQRVQVEAPYGCRWVVHEMIHTYPTMAILSSTYQAYQELGIVTVIALEYWTNSRINDLVAKYSNLFEDWAVRAKMERFGVSVDGRTRSEWLGTNCPWLLSLKEARVRSQQRKAWHELREKLRTLARNQKKFRTKGSRWTLKNCPARSGWRRRCTYEEKIGSG